MAETYKVLGQSAPSATTATTVYTVPSATQAVISTISACNQGTSSETFRISIRPDGETLAQKHYLVYDAAISAKDTIFISAGVTIDASDIIEVYASSANFSFNVFGSEIT